MTIMLKDYSHPHHVMPLILQVIKEHANHHKPSPTIRQLAVQVGHSEETILESLELGRVEQITLIQ